MIKILLKVKQELWTILVLLILKKESMKKDFRLMNEGYQLRKQIDDFYGSIESYLHFAEYYSQKPILKNQINMLKQLMKSLQNLIVSMNV